MNEENQKTLIKPGLLVCLHSSVAGGVTYARQTLDVPAPEADGTTAEVHRWETTKVVQDAAERTAAEKIRSKAVAMIRTCCRITSFGPICPLDREDDLRTAIRAARRMVVEFNSTATVTRVSVTALPGRVASTDEEATAAIAGEVQALLAQMDDAVTALDVEAIRGAASKARELQVMLADDQAAVVSAAVKAARRAARVIVARVQEGGEQAQVVMADLQRGAIIRARAAFLDYELPPVDETTNGTDAGMPAASVQRVAALDMDEVDASAGMVASAVDMGVE